jgi:hypothetical protein
MKNRRPSKSRRRAKSRSCWAVGDPQSTFDRFLAVLDHHGLLGKGGKLRDEVSLLSIGDHFDYSEPRGHAAAGLEGIRILRWLASHPPEQAIVLAGNHDLSRVMELGRMTDRRFAEARGRASEVDRLPEGSPERAALERAFSDSFPDIPTSESARRDYQSWTEEQRGLIQELLRSRRLRLAQAAVKNGRPMLLTHAGVTVRELALLGLGAAAEPAAIARRLNDALDAAVDRAKDRWAEGTAEALDLGDLQVAGRGGREGGGLLYHRPASDPDRQNPGPMARRRFPPADLPTGLAQACGHTVHAKCVHPRVLGPWADPSAQDKNLRGLRTLRVRGPEIRYVAGDPDVASDEAALVMIDGAMNSVSRPSDYALLRVDRWEDP